MMASFELSAVRDTTPSPTIFLAHASEDRRDVERIYDWLRSVGLQPWMDKRDLLPGQAWRQEIPRVIRSATFFLACLSSASIAKRGYVQREMRLALDAMMEMPEDEIYLLPVRLDDCDLPNLETAHGEIGLSDHQAIDFFTRDGRDLLLRAIESRTDWRAPRYEQVTHPLLPDLDASTAELKTLFAFHRRFRAAVVCTDRIAEFLRIKEKEDGDSFFDGRKIQLAVLDPKGQHMDHRAEELRAMSGEDAHAPDYDLAGAVGALLGSLSTRGGKLARALELRTFDTFLPFEIWMFDDEVAIVGWLNASTSTEKQAFYICHRSSPLFPSIQRTLEHIVAASRPLQRSAAYAR